MIKTYIHGINSWLGLTLTSYLLEAGNYKIYSALHNKKSKLPQNLEKNVDIFESDVNFLDYSVGFDLVIYASVPNKNELLFLKKVADNDLPIVYFSSNLAFQSKCTWSNPRITNSSYCRPFIYKQYSDSKWRSERFLLQHSNNFLIVSLCSCHGFSPYLETRSNLLLNQMSLMPIIYLDFDYFQNRCHVSDLRNVEKIIAAGFKKHKLYLGSSDSASQRQFSQLLIKTLVLSGHAPITHSVKPTKNDKSRMMSICHKPGLLNLDTNLLKPISPAYSHSDIIDKLVVLH